MPKRTSRGARQRARTAMLMVRPESFEIGDAVVDVTPPHRLGRVCEVDVPGTIYRVFYVGARQCAAAAHDRLMPAPPGSNPSACPGLC